MKSYRLTALFLIFLLGCSISMSAVDYCASSAFGYGSSATGGGSATPVLVSSVSQLQSALNKGKNKVIIITQNLTFTTCLKVQDGSNVTLMGLPGVKLISNEQTSSTSGILYVKRFSNLIIRNLTFVGPGAYDCDGWDLLCFEGVTNAWVDHCDFQDGCDGNFDNKGNTDNVTISWCRFRYLKAPRAGGSGGSDDHRFTNLLGSSASDKPSDGTFNITWAYCWWDDGCKERMVRCRNCELHFLNCYWNSSVANYYVGPENAKCYFDGCTFEGKANTSSKIFKSYGGTNACKFVGCSGNTPSNAGTISAPSYSYASYTFANAAAAKTAVTNASCGAGATLTVTNAGVVSSACDGGAPAPTVYTVTWNATTNGGTCGTATTMVTSGNAVGSLPEATKDGFSFDGWYTAPSGGTKISSSTTITGNVTYYAQFTSTPVTTYYTIIWDANGGTCGTASTSVESGNAISTAIDPLPTATKAGDYSFDGWYTAVSGGTKITTSTVINANVTYYAHYTSTGGGSCTGTIYSAYTSATGNISIAAGASNLALNTSTHNTTVTGGSMSVYNGQSSAKNLITSSGYCMTNNNTYFRIDLDCPLQSGDAISVDVGKDGSNERGVWISTATTRPGSAPACALTATNASLVPVTYTVTGTDAYHGESTFYIYRATTNSTYFNNINITRAGAALPANFVLSYDENGGSGTMADTEQTGANVTVAANAFTAPTGYGFLKWNTAMNGSGTDHAASDVITLTEDMTLYAIWTPQSYTVTLNAEGGSDGTANVSATYDEAMPSITVPTKAGYVFSGYFTGTNGTGTQYYDGNGSSTNSWDIADATELHAYWVEGSSAPTAGCDLHFWFFKAADAEANGKTNDATVFSAMVADGSNMSGSITIDGTSYSVTRRTGDNATFGSFTIPAGKTGTFYALAVSSGGGDRQIILNDGTTDYELDVAGGSDSYKRIESDELPEGTYSIGKGGGNVRLGVVVVKICGAVTCDADPAAPSGLTAGSITSTGATFTITDDATPTSYDIYYSTESTTPTSGTEATTTTTGKTKVVTGLTVGTTYYAWVRAVCDASHKSAWVALTGSTFATSKMVPNSYTVGATAEGECTGGMTAKITLSGSQIGVDYQLKNNGANDGAAKAGTGSALEWTGKSSGIYTVWAVENATYSALQMSKTATIEVYATTAINTQPATAVAAEADESFTLGTGMVAAGNELAYRWYTCGSTGTDTVFISGATSATYTTSQAVAGTYYYRVRVEGTCGDPVLSNLITVTVGPTGPYWALRGEFDSWSADGTAMTETAGVASVTMSLAANTRYEFKFKYSSDQYGNTGAIATDVSGWLFETTKDNCTLYTGPAGDYTFSINTSSHEASVTYPVVSHPCENYVYFVKPGDWNAVRIYNYTSDVSRMSDWEGSPTITNTTTICEQEYYYCAAYPSFDNIKWRDNASHESTALGTSAGLGKYFNFAVSTMEWQTFATYTISFNAGTGTGTMDPITGICPNGSQEISVNSFAKAGYTFANWIADVATKVGGSDIAAGSAIAGGATLQNIYHDITLTAQWTPNNYTIDLDNQSATGAGTASVVVTYNANTNLLVPIACPHKTGYFFDGYYTETNGGGVQLIDRSGNFIASQTGYTDASRNWVHAGNVTLYAKWTALTVTLTLSPTLIAPSTATNVTYTITTNAPTGTTIPYSFAIFNFGTSEYAGGYLDGAHDINSSLSTTVSMNMAEGTWYTRAVIVWNGSELATSEKTMLQVGSLYTVTYDANSGTVSPASRTQASIGASITLDTPTRDGYTFLGWYVGATKIGDGGESYTPTADVTAIAAWKQDCVGGGGSTTLFNVDFTDETTEQIRATTSGASWVAKTYDTYSMSFGSKDADAGVIDIINGTGLRFTGNNMNSYNCLAIPLTLAKDEQVTAVVTLGDATKIKYNWVSGAMPATPSNGSSGSTYGTNSTTNTLEYTPTTAGDYVLYLGRSGSSSGKIVESIVITQGGAGGTCYYVTYDGNGADGGYTNDPTAYDEDDEVTVLANGFTKTGVAFKGWAASTDHRDAETIDYLPGATFNITANTTLYAIWGSACATTPDAPTLPTNGTTTQNSQDVSWTDDANSQWEVYVNNNSATPAVDQTPTASLTAKTYTFTGLTPSTPYYWWVRSVCDASHKSAWVAGTSFTTNAPTYTLTNAVSPAGYGTISPASVTGIPSGRTTSISTNTYTVNGTTVTATPADATAQYRYEFSNWSGLPATVTADAEVTAVFIQLPQQYDIILHTNGGTINSGNVEHYLYGTGATLPTDVTKGGGATFMGWYDNDSFTGLAVTTIPDNATGNKEYWAKWIVCPETNSGDAVYKFVTKSSGLGTGAVCAATNTDYDLATPSPLSTLIGGTLTARGTGSLTQLSYHNDCFSFSSGTNVWLKVTLECPIADGDIIRYINNNSGSIYVRHTSKSTSDDQITLSGNSTTNVQTMAIPAAFVGKTELYLVRNSNTSYISYFEIVRSCPLTLDAGTNGGTVGGNSTQVQRVAKGDVVALPHAFKDGYTFAGWFIAPSGGSPVSNPYTITGATTLYAQFEDCPHDGAMYKFEVGTGLTNGSVTANNVAFEFTTENYLSTLIAGTLTTAGEKASKVSITGTNAININDNAAYLKVDLDCEIQAGDVFKSTVSGNTVYVSKATSRTKTVELPTGTLIQTPIPATLVGEKTLYIWKGDGSSNALTYFEITRPKQTNITLNASGAYNHYTTSVVATYEQPMPEVSILPMRVGYVFGGYYDGVGGTGTQYYNGLGESVRNWDKDVTTATLYAKWVEPCEMVPTLTTIVPKATIWDGQYVDMALVQLSCDYDTTGIHYSLVSASEAIAGCTFRYMDERIYIYGTPTLGNVSTETKTITFTMTNDCSPASTYTVTATIRIYPASQRAKIAYIVRGTKGGGFNEYNSSDASNSSDLLTYLGGYYDVTCVNGYATKDAAAIATYYDQYDLLIVTDYMETPEGYTNAIGTLIDKKPILSFEAYVAGENGSNWHIGSNPKDPSPKVQDMKILCAGHAIFKDAKYDPADAAETTVVRPDTTVHVLDALSSAGDAKGLQGFVINEAPDFIFLATVRDETNKRDLIVSCERQVVFPARLLLYGINYYEMGNLSNAGKIIMHQMIDYLLMTDETKVADCSLVFDDNNGTGVWSDPKNWFPGYNIVPTPYHPTRIIAECHIDIDNAHAGSVKVNTGRDEHGNPVDGKLIVEPYGGLTIAGIVAKVNDTRYASPITIKAEDLLIKANASQNGAFVYGNKESDVRATVQYYSRAEGANTATPTWQYIGIPFQANQTAIRMYYEAWMCRWTESTTDALGGLWQWVDNNDVLIPFEGYCITQASPKTYTFAGKLNAPVTTVIGLDNRDADGFAFAANSWTAPIKIQEMADDDFVNAEKSIYIYHTGSYASWESKKDELINPKESATAVLPGQYAVIPIHSSPYLGADSVIPAMQGFFVKTTDADAELKLVYNRTVYDATYFKTSTQPMRAPSKTSEPDVMRLIVVGETSGGDQVHILSRGDFSDGYEDGWDGRKLDGDEAAPKLAVVKQAGEMAVAAVESADGRYLSFRAGEDSIYTFSFNYAGETLYLYDQLTEIATEIRTGNTYTFEATNETAFHRFLITSTPPKTPTDIESLESESLKLRGAEKFIQDDKLFILYKGVVYDARGARITGRKEAAQ